MSTTYINNKSGEAITTSLTRKQIAERFISTASDDSWLWFWLAKHASERDTSNSEIISLMFLIAMANGIQRPRITVRYEGYRFQLYLSKRGTLCFKAAPYHKDFDGETDIVGEAEYFGCCYDHRFIKSRDIVNLPDVYQDFLDKLLDDPATFLAECGRDMGCCCYCNKALTTEPSKAFGYGKQCAGNWGLPYNNKAKVGDELPGFAALMKDDNVINLLREVRNDPYNEEKWGIVGDLMEDYGLARPGVPSQSVTLPN